jgi:hypothetical protein
MGVNVIRAKSLHAEVVDEAIISYKLDLLLDLLIRSHTIDKPKCYTKTIPLQISKLDGFETTLERANFYFWVPVFAALLSDQLLCICSLNRSNLTRNPSLVLVACNADLPRHLLDSLCDVMHSMHRLYVLFVNHDLQILRDMWFGPLVQIKLSTSPPRQTSCAVKAHLSGLACHVLVINNGVTDVLGNFGFEQSVEFRAFLFIFEGSPKYDRLVHFYHACFQIRNELFKQVEIVFCHEHAKHCKRLWVDINFFLRLSFLNDLFIVNHARKS